MYFGTLYIYLIAHSIYPPFRFHLLLRTLQCFATSILWWPTKSSKFQPSLKHILLGPLSIDIIHAVSEYLVLVGIQSQSKSSIQSPFQDPQRRQYPRLSQFLSKYQNLITIKSNATFTTGCKTIDQQLVFLFITYFAMLSFIFICTFTFRIMWWKMVIFNTPPSILAFPIITRG